MYLNDVATIPANLAGIPGLSLPGGLADEDGLPVGIQLLAPARQDARLYRVGAVLESILEEKWGGPMLAQAPVLAASTDTAGGRLMSVDATLSFEEAMEKYDPVLGFEVHVELNTKTKMFSSAPNVFGDEPNTNVNEVDLGMPGVLPVVNKTAVESSIKIGLALNCKIAESCRFARKNYFYPDTPKNFQTSQYDEPIAYDGYLDIELEDGTVFRVEIERAHMEEDAGKLTHMGGAAGRIQGADYSLVDYNRSGVPLVEIVTKPIEGAGSRAPELAKAYVAAVREIVKNLGVSDAKMERGNVRCDANVSLRPHGRERFGIRSETKNVNSLRAVEHAVRYEIQRHAAVLDSGEPVIQETRHWHEDTRTDDVGPAQVRR